MNITRSGAQICDWDSSSEFDLFDMSCRYQRKRSASVSLRQSPPAVEQY